MDSGPQNWRMGMMRSWLGRSSGVPSRREVLAGVPMALAGAAALGGRAFAQEEEPEYAIVSTAYGRLRGAKTGDLTTFKGIPYGGSVSGANRFKAAPPPESWTGVRDALEIGARSMQPGQGRGGESQDEDCLFLNIWSPAADDRRRPVMFYNHGGGFTTGSGGSGHQDASNLARTFDVVVVATNHRLGLFGYLYLGELGGEEYATSGNQGMLDIADGLKWVNENIEVFGGDPDNVMVFGESGGGAKTSAVYAMPSAKPYFNKASIESGPGIFMYPREAAVETTLMVLKELGLEPNQWRRLLEIPAADLVAAQSARGDSGGGPLALNNGRRGMTGNPRPGGFGPVVDGSVLPQDPFDPGPLEFSKDKPLMVGYNHDEMVFFFGQGGQNSEIFTLTEDALKQRLSDEFGDNADDVYAAYHESRPDASPSELYVAIATARAFGIGSQEIAARKHAQGGAPAYMYIFKHANDSVIPGTDFKRGTPHAMDISYKFYNVPLGGRGGPSQEDIKASHNMAEMWSTFARTGHPGAEGQPEWPPYTTENHETMEIDTECVVVNDPYRLERELWARLDP